MTIIDTNSNTSGALADLKRRGVTTIGRYYSRTGSWKALTAAEARLIDAAGLEMFVVFEEDGDPTLSADVGQHHAQLAVQQAQAIGQPKGSAIYFALEHLPNGYTLADVAGVKTYISGLKSVIGDDYRIGVYSDGVVCKALLAAGLCDYAWLSASRGFPGSEAFYEAGGWAIAQSPQIDQTWGTLSVDTNEAAGPFGAFRLSGAGSAALAAAAGAVPAALAAAAGGFAAQAVAIATQEWNYFGGQTYDADGHLTHRGHSEVEPGYAQRIGTYWLDGTGTNGLSGTDTAHPWSAAFISWVMKTAGAGPRFRYSTQHSVYISQGIRDALSQRAEAGYWTVRLGDARPRPGDLICWGREPGIDYDHQKGGIYMGHSDLVVDVSDDAIQVIGGNVGNSVTKRPVRLGPGGYLQPLVVNGENLFALMQCRL